MTRLAIKKYTFGLKSPLRVNLFFGILTVVRKNSFH